MPESRPLILITNDDGIDAPGLRNLIDFVRDIGDLVVVAPERGMSGMSHAITVRDPLRLRKLREVPGLTEYSCNGTPVDAVKLGEKMVLKKNPNLLLSGINHGSNASVNILYSGTMGAVLEGCMIGLPSIGFSLLDYAYDADFSASRTWVRRIVKMVLQQSLPQGICLNVNIPAVPESEIKGMKVVRQADGAWEETFEARQDPYHQDYFWLSGKFTERKNGSDTDLVVLRDNYISIVPVQYDFTAHSAIPAMKSFNVLQSDFQYKEKD